MIDIKLIKKSIIPIVVFISFGFSSFGQNALSAAGGHFKSSGGSTSFTVGQVAYVLKKGTGSSLNEGVQQVYSKKTTPVEELVYLKEVQLYPNPTQETMTLILSFYDKYSLFVWGQNLNNERYLAYGNPDSSFGRQARIAQPRTVGITLSAKF